MSSDTCDPASLSTGSQSPVPRCERLHVAVSVSTNTRTGRIAALAAAPLVPLQSPRTPAAAAHAFYCQVDTKYDAGASLCDYPPLASPRPAAPTAVRPSARAHTRMRSRSVSMDLATLSSLPPRADTLIDTSPRPQSPKGRWPLADALAMLVGWLAQRMDGRDTQIVLWTAGPPWRLVRGLVGDGASTLLRQCVVFDDAVLCDARDACAGAIAGVDWAPAVAATGMALTGVETDAANDALGPHGSALAAVAGMQRVVGRHAWSPLQRSMGHCPGAAAAEADLQALVGALLLPASRPAVGNYVSDLAAVMGADVRRWTRFGDAPLRPLWRAWKKHGRAAAEDHLRATVFGGDYDAAIDALLDALSVMAAGAGPRFFAVGK